MVWVMWLQVQDEQLFKHTMKATHVTHATRDQLDFQTTMAASALPEPFNIQWRLHILFQGFIR